MDKLEASVLWFVFLLRFSNGFSLEIIKDEKRNSLYGKDVEISVLKSREGILKKENSELKINLEL